MNLQQFYQMEDFQDLVKLGTHYEMEQVDWMDLIQYWKCPVIVLKMKTLLMILLTNLKEIKEIQVKLRMSFGSTENIGAQSVRQKLTPQ